MTKDELKSNKKLNIQIITLSDRASKGEYEDLSGPEIKKSIDEYFTNKSWKFQTSVIVIPDDATQLENLLILAKNNKTDIVITTGGTGIGPRDFTPEVAKKVIEKEIPGIMENIRIKYGQQKPNALLSRGIAGVMGQTQLYCLPGSVKAVIEYMTEILKTLEHLIFMMFGVDTHGKHLKE
jgi:molybdenum cofactor synthesis domain-containing protein